MLEQIRQSRSGTCTKFSVETSKPLFRWRATVPVRKKCKKLLIL